MFRERQQAGGPFKLQSSCCNRRLEDWSFPRGGAYACCSDQQKRSIFRGKSEFRGTARTLALKKKKNNKKKEAEKGLATKDPGERESVQSALLPRPSASRLGGALRHSSDPFPEQARPQAPRPSGLWDRPGSLPDLGRGRPWLCPQLLDDLQAGISKRRLVRQRARRGVSGLAPQTFIGGFPGLRAMPRAV